MSNAKRRMPTVPKLVKVPAVTRPSADMYPSVTTFPGRVHPVMQTAPWPSK